MKFGTLVDVTEQLKMQKNVKISYYLWSYDHFKKRRFYSLRFNEPA